MNIYPNELIRKKRDGRTISAEELNQFVSDYVSGIIPDYQMSAFLMAVYFQGMEPSEMTHLVRVMRDSGEILQLNDLQGPKIDKHSTGGVGDKISLILAPLLSCMGIYVPMISGRGLGYSGGTLDKLESIPELNVHISLNKFKEILKQIGFVIAGSTNQIVPADQKMYMLRDATATIESLPLVVGSIMSKKLAENLDGLVLDVKTGKGAFFRDKRDAIRLASNLVAVGEDFNVPVRALLTNMDQPIGYAVGNWIEVREAVQCLKGEGPTDIVDEVYNMTLMALRIAGFRQSKQELFPKLQRIISEGVPMERFLRYVRLMGGDVTTIEHPDHFPLPKPSYVYAPFTGYITEIDAYNIGMAASLAGAGRKTIKDNVDPGAGIQLHKKIGDHIREKELIAEIYTHKNDKEEMIGLVESAIGISKQKPEEYDLIFGEVNRYGQLEQLED